MTSKHHPPRLILPPPLKRGDTVALILPASRLEEDFYEASLKAFREEGFFVATFPGKKKRHRFFSAADEDRAKELNWALTEPGINAVFCCRGGYGSMRLLPYLHKFNLKKWRPKIFVGYSDVCFLHQWLSNRLGWLSFHGPLVGQISKTALVNMIEEVLRLPDRKAEVWSECRLIRKGQAEGRLVGGNLSMLQTSGEAALPREKLILALEDVNEYHYRIDRMIWALIHAGYSRFVKGIVLGSFHQCGKVEKNPFPWEWIRESLEQLCPDGPILEAAQFGHGLKVQRLLPLGMKLRLKGKEFRWQRPLVQS